MRCLKGMIRLLLAAYAAVLLVFLVPSVCGMQLYTVISASMAPQIAPGALVFVRKTPFAQIGRGEIITFRQNGGGPYITHRVAEVCAGSKGFRTKGDANEAEDAMEIPYENVAGTVRFTLPYLGYLALFLEGTAQKSLFAGMLLWLLLLERVLNDFIEIKRKEMGAV